MTEFEYRLDGKAIIINGKVIKLPYPSVQALILHGLIIVRVEPPIGEIYNRNILALESNGRLKWQISESPHGTEADKPYMFISINDRNELIAGNWNGVDYIVDLHDGSISTKSFSK